MNKYVWVRHPSQPNKWVLEHVLVAERALGRPLPRGAVVHHVNHVRNDNRPCNLVVCQNASYHMLIHSRERALIATGDANLRRCKFCRSWDDPSNMRRSKSALYHLRCSSRHAIERKRAARPAGWVSPYANRAENACLRGHPYEPGSYRLRKNNGRICKICDALRHQSFRKRTAA